jgi:phosphoglycolate phosphatase-like HAD superfamily hydrolase
MKLTIFDIDGTLTNTNRVDEECFVQAFADLYGVTDIDTNWADYPHATDSGITLQIFQERWGRAPDPSEVSRLKQSFVSFMQSQFSIDPTLFAEIPGAASMLERLRRESEWAVSIATGCWSESAEMKLKAAGIDASGIPLACADDSLSREEILRAAVSKAQAHYAQNDFERIVSIGDGVWDVRTALHLNFAFVGIGGGEHEKLLRDTGATYVLGDYSDFEQVVRGLNEAGIPKNLKEKN